jgi:protein-S-isoprenylcysteine O-methyltransferase Ste14
MSTGHLILSVGLSIYILVAIRWEERDLAAAYGVPYHVYRQKVPMLIPFAAAWGKQRNQQVDP